MNILMALLFSRALNSKGIDYKRTAKNLRRDTKFLIQVIKELVQLMNIITRFVFVGVSTVIKKCFCQRKTVEEVKLPENIISLKEYKFKKAK